MPAPAWQYHEPDHPGANFDAMAEIYDRNMQKFRDVQGEIVEILDFLALQPADYPKAGSWDDSLIQI